MKLKEFLDKVGITSLICDIGKNEYVIETVEIKGEDSFDDFDRVEIYRYIEEIKINDYTKTITLKLKN